MVQVLIIYFYLLLQYCIIIYYFALYYCTLLKCTIFCWCDTVCARSGGAHPPAVSLSRLAGLFCEWRLAVLWREDGWMGGMEGRAWRGREGEMEATSHYVSAVHQGNWSVCDSYCQDVEGRRVMERGEREREREKGRGRRRRRQRGRGWGRERRKGGGLFFFCPTFRFFFLSFPSLHPPSVM